MIACLCCITDVANVGRSRFLAGSVFRSLGLPRDKQEARNEVMKFARNVHFQIKNGQTDKFNSVFTNDVLPLLKKQKGFQEELTLANAQHTIGISVWEDRPSAEVYNTNTYPQVLAKLAPMLDGTPRVETFDVTTTLSA